MSIVICRLAGGIDSPLLEKTKYIFHRKSLSVISTDRLLGFIFCVMQARSAAGPALRRGGAQRQTKAAKPPQGRTDL